MDAKIPAVRCSGHMSLLRGSEKCHNLCSQLISDYLGSWQAVWESDKPGNHVLKSLLHGGLKTGTTSGLKNALICSSVLKGRDFDSMGLQGLRSDSNSY